MIYSPACHLLLVDMTARQKLGQPVDSILRVPPSQNLGEWKSGITVEHEPLLALVQHCSW